jgi:hypothetical protein
MWIFCCYKEGNIFQHYEKQRESFFKTMYSTRQEQMRAWARKKIELFSQKISGKRKELLIFDKSFVNMKMFGRFSRNIKFCEIASILTKFRNFAKTENVFSFQPQIEN